MSGLSTFVLRCTGVVAVIAIISGGIWAAMGAAGKKDVAGAAKSVDSLDELDLSSATNGTRGWVSGNITTGDEKQAPVSGDRVAWWQTVTENRYQVKSRQCNDSGCEERWNWISMQTDDTRADVEIALEVEGETFGVSIPDQTLTQAEDAEGHDPAIWHLEDNESATTNEPDSAQRRMEITTTYEYVLREGDGLTLIGEFDKVDGTRTVSAIANHPMVVDSTFDSYRAVIKAQNKGSGNDIRNGVALLGGGLLGLALVIALAKRRQRRHSP